MRANLHALLPVKCFNTTNAINVVTKCRSMASQLKQQLKLSTLCLNSHSKAYTKQNLLLEVMSSLKLSNLIEVCIASGRMILIKAPLHKSTRESSKNQINCKIFCITKNMLHCTVYDVKV